MSSTSTDRQTQDHVPFEADMAVPPSPDLYLVVQSPDFAALVERIKRDFQVAITPNVKPWSSGMSESTGDNTFKFRCQRSNSDFLAAAREMLEQFLLNHNVHIYPSATAHTHKRGDSFAEAFPHFDSKLLSAHRTRHTGESSLTIVVDNKLTQSQSQNRQISVGRLSCRPKIAGYGWQVRRRM